MALTVKLSLILSESVLQYPKYAPEQCFSNCFPLIWSSVWARTLHVFEKSELVFCLQVPNKRRVKLSDCCECIKLSRRTWTKFLGQVCLKNTDCNRNEKNGYENVYGDLVMGNVCIFPQWCRKKAAWQKSLYVKNVGLHFKMSSKHLLKDNVLY